MSVLGSVVLFGKQQSSLPAGFLFDWMLQTFKPHTKPSEFSPATNTPTVQVFNRGAIWKLRPISSKPSVSSTASWRFWAVLTTNGRFGRTKRAWHTHICSMYGKFTYICHAFHQASPKCWRTSHEILFPRSFAGRWLTRYGYLPQLWSFEGNSPVEGKVVYPFILSFTFIYRVLPPSQVVVLGISAINSRDATTLRLRPGNCMVKKGSSRFIAGNKNNSQHMVRNGQKLRISNLLNCLLCFISRLVHQLTHPHHAIAKQKTVCSW